MDIFWVSRTRPIRSDPNSPYSMVQNGSTTHIELVYSDSASLPLNAKTIFQTHYHREYYLNSHHLAVLFVTRDCGMKTA